MRSRAFGVYSGPRLWAGAGWWEGAAGELNMDFRRDLRDWFLVRWTNEQHWWNPGDVLQSHAKQDVAEHGSSPLEASAIREPAECHRRWLAGSVQWR